MSYYKLGLQPTRLNPKTGHLPQQVQTAGVPGELSVGAGLAVAAVAVIGIIALANRKKPPSSPSSSRKFMRMAGWQGHSRRLMGSGILG